MKRMKLFTKKPTSVRKTGFRITLMILAITLVLSGCTSGCNEQTKDTGASSSETVSADQNSGTSSGGSNTGTESTPVSGGTQRFSENTGDAGTTVNKTDRTYARPSRTKGNYVPIAKQSATGEEIDFDLRVSSFDVGSFYHSVDVGMHAEGQYAEWVPGNLNNWKRSIPKLDADIYGLQQFCPLFYESKKDNVTLKSADQFAQVFKTLKIGSGTTFDDTLNMYLGLAAHKDSPYDITNVTYGYLCSGSSSYRRLFARGILNFKGTKIAVYSVHLFSGNDTALQDSVTDLITRMNKEDFCIVTGDMQSNTVAQSMIKAGYNVANGGKFGNFSTYEYNENNYYDNIFTSSNIDINYVECEKKKAGGSDHYPLTAYLKINTGKGSAKKESAFKVGEDGFYQEWYRP